MSPKSKFYWMIVLTLVVAWSLIAIWTVTDQEIFLGLLLGWIFVGGWLIKSVRCPSCGVPVSYQGKLGTMQVHGAFAAGCCRNCGHRLNAPDSGK